MSERRIASSWLQWWAPVLERDVIARSFNLTDGAFELTVATVEHIILSVEEAAEIHGASRNRPGSNSRITARKPVAAQVEQDAGTDERALIGTEVHRVPAFESRTAAGSEVQARGPIGRSGLPCGRRISSSSGMPAS